MSKEIPVANLETLLTPEDEKRIAKEAETEVKAELKERVAKDLKARHKQQILTEMQGERMKGEPVEEVLLDMPSFAQTNGIGGVMLDGRIYQHGMTHKVPKSVAAVLRSQMHMAWRHEAERKGELNPVANRRRRHQSVSMGGRAAA